MSRNRIILSVAGLIWLMHIGVVLLLQGHGLGPILSDTVQFVLGAMLIYSIVQASDRSEGMAISFWRLAAVAYTLLFVAQVLSVYNDLFHTSADHNRAADR